MPSLSYVLYPQIGRSILRVVSPEGIPESPETVTEIFYGILKAIAIRLFEIGRPDDARNFSTAIARDVTIDVEDLLRCGYRIEGVPDPLWNLLLTR